MDGLMQDGGAAGVAALLEQVSRVVQAHCFADGMHPVQWSALRYFSKASAPARTVSALANYQGTTLPPASRTVAALVNKGFLTMTIDPADRRSRKIDLTDAGRVLVSQDPILGLMNAIGALSVDDRKVLISALEGILIRLNGKAPGNASDDGLRGLMPQED